MSREFFVACNWEKELIDGLSKYPEVKWVFGKLRSDVIGGGRPSFNLPELSRQDAIKYIEYLHSRGIKFIYLFNSSCLGNKQFDAQGEKKIIKELEWSIYKAKVDAITVSTHSLFRLIKDRYPKVKVGIGLYKKIEDLEQFKYYDDLGVEWITVQRSFLKDFDFLEKLRKTVNCKLKLIVNEVCKYWCPYALYHTNSFSHMSQDDSDSGKLWLDPYLFNCVGLKLENPAIFVKSGYIRPEDMNLYEEIGYKGFKIVDRHNSSRWLLNTVNAYIRREYKGNLLDIVRGRFLGKDDVANKVSRQFLSFLFKNHKYDWPWVKFYFGKHKEGYPYIDNKKMEGVAKEFYKQHQGHKYNCSECGYCKTKSVDISEINNHKEYRELINILTNALSYAYSDEARRNNCKQSK